MTAATLRSLVRPGVAALRRLWLPFVLIQFAGLCLVLAYFHLPAVARACDRVGEVKTALGVAFAMLTMPVACGLVPELFKTIAGVERGWPRRRVELMLHNMGLFCVGGLTVDVMYMLLAHFLGGGRAPGVVASKVMLDMLCYTPALGVPMIAFSFTLRRRGYAVGPALRMLSPAWYAREVVPVLVPCWAYWFPMTALMYTLPPTLTFVYSLVASAASSILLTAVAGRAELGDAHA